MLHHADFVQRLPQRRKLVSSRRGKEAVLLKCMQRQIRQIFGFVWSVVNSSMHYLELDRRAIQECMPRRPAISGWQSLTAHVLVITCHATGSW